MNGVSSWGGERQALDTEFLRPTKTHQAPTVGRHSTAVAYGFLGRTPW